MYNLVFGLHFVFVICVRKSYTEIGYSDIHYSANRIWITNP